MVSTRTVVVVALGLIVGKWIVQLALEWLNWSNVQANSKAVPQAFKGIIDEPTYSKSVAYTLAKGRLRVVELTYDLVILIAALFSGVLPWAVNKWVDAFGS